MNKKSIVYLAVMILLLTFSLTLSACVPTAIKVNFVVDDKVEAIIEVRDGTEFPTISPKDGYTLSEWYFDKECTEKFSFEKLTEKGLDGEVSVYARWRLNQYAITFEENGGSIVDDITADYGATVTKPADPTRAGYTFGSWYTDNTTFADEFVFNTMPVDGATVYAKWIANQYAITFEENGGSIVDDITADYGATVTKPADPTRAGYTFGGWYTDNTTFADEFVFNTMPVDGATVYAKWIANGYAITFEENVGSTVDDITADYGATVTKPADPTRAGYTFGGWYTDNTAFADEFVFNTMPLDGATVYAKWDKNPSTQGLAYTYNSGIDGYVVAKGTASADGTVIIAEVYDDGTNGEQLVKRIGDSAFFSCSSLVSIVIPNSLTRIGAGAFGNCSSLASITIPNSVTSIGAGAFGNCSSLASIVIPNSVTSIGTGTLKDCGSLASITVADGNAKYHSAGNCLIETSTKTLIVGCKTSVIPTDGSVTSIGENAFHGCSSLTSITIPNGVTVIGGYAFHGCSSLTSITIPNGVTVIGGYAFRDCGSLTSIVIPEGATSIGENAFNGCSSLTSAVIPDSVTRIGEKAFNACSSLVSIVIPDSVTNIGRFAFNGCSALASITVADGNARYHSAGNCLIETSTKILILGCKTSVIPADGSVTSIGENAFHGCRSLASIVIPKGVTSIGRSAFGNCSSLASIVIPEGVTSIARSVFGNCSSLASIVIPDSVTRISENAFRGCSSLVSITFNGTKVQWENIYNGNIWDDNTGAYIVYCTDGNISKDNV